MAKVVYLDRNAFHHIRDRHRPEIPVTEGDYQTIRNAVKSGKLVIARSLTLLEETLPVLEAKDVNIAPVEQKLINDLTDESKFILHWSELVEYDVAFYAYGWAPLPSRFRFTTEFTGSERYLTPDIAEREKLLNVVQETKDGKREVSDGLHWLKTNAATHLESAPRMQPTFEQVYDDYAIEMVEDLAERFGVLNECRARGIEGLLDMHSIKVYVVAALSLNYALAYENLRLNPKKDQGYWHDLQHAVLASATDAFVTQDGKWRRILERMRIDGFEVIDLQTLVQQIQ